MSKPIFTCKDVHVYIDEKEIVKGVSLEINPGETHAIMGPNGSGKSTLAAAIMGHPAYRLEGTVEVNGRNVVELSPDERARAGVYLGFQHPISIPGVPVAQFLRTAIGARTGQKPAIKEFRKNLLAELELLGLDKSFMSRFLNDGFSGGEKKRLEIVQMSMLKPDFALLDEIDSGLDIDALKVVAKGIKRLADQQKAVLIVTHYQRILDHLQPDFVHVLVDGKIITTGGIEQARALEEHGYDYIKNISTATVLEETP